MTQVRRKKKQQGLTLVRIFLVLAAILVAAILLFRIDAFPNRKGPNSGRRTAPLLSPDKLLSSQDLAQQLRGKAQEMEGEADAAAVRERRRQEAKEEEAAADGEASTDGANNDIVKGKADNETVKGKRYSMKLAGLNNDDTRGSGVSGVVVIETHPEWAPLGVAHFDDLVQHGFYDECRFFRVVKNFVSQFGINGDPEIQTKWKADVLKDDPVVETNARGTLTYATSGPNTRTTQLFINTNTKGNAYLDKEGFAPFAVVVEGMEYVDQINDEYAQQPDQGKIQRRGNEYLNQEFPRLSYIVSIRELQDGESPN